MDKILEICAGSLASCVAAQEGGAQRVELCDNLGEGGTTPSYGALAMARGRLNIALHAIIRPRGGDFLYSALEFDAMAHDVEVCRSLGLDGVVLGLLTADGDVDVARTRQLAALAGPMAVTFHRAFDLAREPEQALEDVIAAGCSRLLSSGQAASAPEGAALLARLREQAGGRLTVMPGAGVRPGNIAGLAAASGCIEFHASARGQVASAMRYRRGGVGMGASGVDEYARQETSASQVRALRAALDKA
ncbi:copper homeostasis protein CutC [Chromobacterium violaceum]|uniref:copper homeostasis protein CutC n=1 Tax=Chromobacterium violaceum TaxID=536 RepID=UPI0009DA3B8F|nr:copper homeostasis protein CutC [Chromobacterium violaceum]MBP4050769.1 copper homeostasis protein CutC [Chromobacterium violaceum]MBT2869006.1 copper homeostasis protein CutC [Chromobacterium violaceum]OQS21935.1 copper homeostasis protein CutC [Chromobacterium violaceum]